MKLSKNSYIRYCDVNRSRVTGVDGWTVHSSVVTYTGSPVTYITASDVFGTRSTVTHFSDTAYRTFFVTNSTISSAAVVTDVYRKPFAYSYVSPDFWTGPPHYTVATSFHRSFFTTAIPSSVALDWISSDLQREGWEAEDISQLSYSWETGYAYGTDYWVFAVTLGDAAPLRYVSYTLHGGANAQQAISAWNNDVKPTILSRRAPRFALSCVRPAALPSGRTGTQFLFRSPDAKHTIGNVTYTVVSYVTARALPRGTGMFAEDSYGNYTLQCNNEPTTVSISMYSGQRSTAYSFAIYPQRLPAEFTFISSGAVVSGLRHVPRGFYWVTSGGASFPVDAHASAQYIGGGLYELVSGSAHFVMVRTAPGWTCSEYVDSGIYTVRGSSLVTAPDVTVNVADFVMVYEPPILRHRGDVSGIVLADDAAIALSDNLQVRVVNGTIGARFHGDHINSQRMLVNIPASNGTCSRYEASIYTANNVTVIASPLIAQTNQEPSKITCRSQYNVTYNHSRFYSGNSSGINGGDTRYYGNHVRSSYCCSSAALSQIMELVPSFGGSTIISVLQNTDYLDEFITHTSIYNEGDTHRTGSYYASIYDVGSPMEAVTYYSDSLQPLTSYIHLSLGYNKLNNACVPIRCSVNPASMWVGSDAAASVSGFGSAGYSMRGSCELDHGYMHTYVIAKSGSAPVSTEYPITYGYNINVTYSHWTAPQNLLNCVLPLANSVYTVVSSKLRISPVHAFSCDKEASGSYFKYSQNSNGDLASELVPFGNRIYIDVSCGHTAAIAEKRYVSYSGSASVAHVTGLYLRIYSHEESEVVPYTAVLDYAEYTSASTDADFDKSTGTSTVSVFRGFTAPTIDAWVSEFKESADRFTPLTLPETPHTGSASRSSASYGHDEYEYSHGYAYICHLSESRIPATWDTYTWLVTMVVS